MTEMSHELKSLPANDENVLILLKLIEFNL